MEGFFRFFLLGDFLRIRVVLKGKGVFIFYLFNFCSEIREKGRKWDLDSRVGGLFEKEK